jgi:MYM-type Zinc finger with FCS sequence motif
MKETVTKCNHCGAEIIGPDRLLTFNGEEIDLCSDQCRLKWWMAIANEAEAAGSEIHITSKPGEKPAEEPDDIPKRNLKMLSRE